MKNLYEQVTMSLLMFWSPSRAVESIREKAPFLVPLLIASIAGVVVQFATSPMVETLMRANLAHLQEDQVAQSIEFYRRFQMIGVFTAPLVMLLKWAAVALLLYLLAILVNGTMSFRQVYSLVSFSSLALVAESAIVLLILLLRGVESIQTQMDLQPAIGLNLLFPGLAPAWHLLLNNANIFELWYVVLLVLGIRQLNRFSTGKAVAVVVAVWLFGVGLQSATTALGMAL